MNIDKIKNKLSLFEGVKFFFLLEMVVHLEVFILEALLSLATHLNKFVSL